MLGLFLAFRYLVVTTFFGVLYVLWLSNRKWRKYTPPDKELMKTPYLNILVFSLVGLVVFAGLYNVDDFTIDPVPFWTKLVSAGFGWPFVFLFMVLFSELADWLNKRGRQRDE